MDQQKASGPSGPLTRGQKALHEEIAQLRKTVEEQREKIEALMEESVKYLEKDREFLLDLEAQFKKLQDVQKPLDQALKYYMEYYMKDQEERKNSKNSD